jgi:hypothetical protein
MAMGCDDPVILGRARLRRFLRWIILERDPLDQVQGIAFEDDGYD